MEPVNVYVKINFIMIAGRQHIELQYINTNTNELVRKEIFPYEQD